MVDPFPLEPLLAQHGQGASLGAPVLPVQADNLPSAQRHVVQQAHDECVPDTLGRRWELVEHLEDGHGAWPAGVAVGLRPQVLHLDAPRDHSEHPAELRKGAQRRHAAVDRGRAEPLLHQAGLEVEGELVRAPPTELQELLRRELARGNPHEGGQNVQILTVRAQRVLVTSSQEGRHEPPGRALSLKRAVRAPQRDQRLAHSLAKRARYCSFPQAPRGLHAFSERQKLVKVP